MEEFRTISSCLESLDRLRAGGDQEVGKIHFYLHLYSDNIINFDDTTATKKRYCLKFEEIISELSELIGFLACPIVDENTFMRVH